MKKRSAIFLCALCAALCLVMTLAFTSCGKENKPAETKGESQSSASTEAPTDTQSPADTDATTEATTDAVTEASTDAPGESDTTDPEETKEPGPEDYDPEQYVVISNAEDLMAFNKAANEDEEEFYDMTVVFLDDIDMTGYTWTPLDSSAMDGITFDGKGHTISNLVFADHDPVTGTPAAEICSGFIGANLGSVTFRDLTIKDASVVAYERHVAAFIGVNNAPGCFVVFENCHVDGFKADGWMDYNNDVMDEQHPISFRLAGYIGNNMAGYCEFTDCSAKDLELSGFHNLAAFVGYDASGTVDEFCFTNCKVQNCKFTFSYCVASAYEIDQPRKFVSVFYNANNWGDNIDYVAENGNTYSGVVFYDWSDNNAEHYPDDFRSWTREEATL